MHFIFETLNKDRMANPSSAAIIYKDTTLSYLELDERSNNTAQLFIDAGIKRKDKVAILSGNTLEFIITVLALWKIEAIPVPLNIRHTKEELLNIISFMNFRHMIGESKYISKFSELSITLINFPLNIKKQSQANLSLNAFNKESTALIMFTSGSSGKPKGVMLSFNNLIQSAYIGNQLLQHSENNRWLASLPFYHIGGFSIIIRSLLFGAAIILPETLNIDDISAAVIKHQPTFASLVSTQLKRLIEMGCKPGSSLRNALLGGGFVEKSLLTAAVEKGWKVSTVYGSTETASFVAGLFINKNASKINSAGKPFHPNKIIIVDANGKELPLGEAGEIAISGNSIMQGYFNNQEETEKKLRDGYYYTGDIGYLDLDGYLYIEARRTDLIVSGGENVNPIEIENEIIKHPNISDVCVFGLKDEKWGQIVSAVVITKDEKKITINELKDFLIKKIAGYKIPKKLFLAKNLPRTELNKLERKKIQQYFNNKI